MTDKFKSIQISHLALTQYYRWYQVYEVPFTEARIANQLDILSDDVEIASQAGLSKGKESLPDRLKLFEGWLNAHHVQNTEVVQIDDETIALEADILYQNIRPDNSRYSYTIHYSTRLKLRGDDLPVFNKVNIQGTGMIDDPQFTPAYADNRAKSWMHRWLYGIETANGNSAMFKELLAPNFEINTSTSGKINTTELFDQWIASMAQRVKNSGHTPKNFVAKQNDDGTIAVSVDFEWQGISIDDKNMIAETHHEWLLENDMDERFARVKTMHIAQTIPFTVVA